MLGANMHYVDQNISADYWKYLVRDEFGVKPGETFLDE